MDYRQRFKDLRIDYGYRQQDIAKICNVSDATVGHWENLKRHMSVDCIILLCRFYNVSADYILGLTNNYRTLH